MNFKVFDEFFKLLGIVTGCRVILIFAHADPTINDKLLIKTINCKSY
jgi:hypothetical protein